MQQIYDKRGDGVCKGVAVDQKEEVLKQSLAALLGKPTSVKEAVSPAILLGYFFEESKLQKETVLSRTKMFSVARPRQVLLYLLYKHTVLSMPEIGRRYGGYDRKTITHSVERVLERLGQHDEETVRLVMGVKKRVELAKAA